MGFNLVAIRQALVDKATDGVARKLNGYAYDPGSPALPAIIVRDIEPTGDTPYHVTLGNGGVDWSFELEVVVPLGGDIITAQKLIDEFRSVGLGMSNSIADAIESQSTTLNALVETLTCVGSSTPEIADLGGTQVMSTRFRVDIMANRS